MGRLTGGFPNDVKVWNYVVVNIGQKKFFFFFVNSFQSRNGIRQSFEVPQCFNKIKKSQRPPTVFYIL